MGVRFLDEGREWRVPCLLKVDDYFLCGESEEHLRAVMARFVERCRSKGLKISRDKKR